LQTMHERIHIMPVENVEVVLARLGVNAGVIGAALWADRKYSGQGGTRTHTPRGNRS
jgi:hypothetical protein